MSRRTASMMLAGLLWLAIPVLAAAEEAAEGVESARAELASPEGDGAVAADAATGEGSGAEAGSEAAEAAGEIDEASAPAPVVVLPRPPAEARLWAAWHPGPGRPLAERVERVQATALDLGVSGLDAAARGLLLDTTLGDPLERAEAAVLLAPDLPDANFALARARLAAGAPGAALASLRRAWGSLDAHLEASLWMRAASLDAVSRIAACGALLFLLVASGVATPRTASGLSVVARVPVVSAAAGLGTWILLPAALGEGPLGVALAAAVLAASVGGVQHRVAVAAAGLLLVVATFPVADRVERELRVLSRATVPEAVHRAERSLATPLDRARLTHAATHHPLAARALALDRKRQGDLRGADRDFRELVAAAPEPPPELLANAANLRLALGETDEAIELYEDAVLRGPTPLLLFNLSRAYGRAIQLEEQDLALEDAQRLDAAAVLALTERVARSEGHGALDLALPIDAVRHLAPDDAATPALRRRLAPGSLGVRPEPALVLFALAVLLPSVTGRWRARLVAAAARAGQRPNSTDPAVRMARMAARRAGEARVRRVQGLLGWVVPGAAAMLAGSPLLALGTGLVACAAWFGVAARGGVVPDALAAGATGAFVFGALALGGLLAYLVLLALGNLLRRSRA